MMRYFMTVPEAVQLIIRAGSLGAQPDDWRSAQPDDSRRAHAGEPGGRAGGAGNGEPERRAGEARNGDVFVLEMGEPVKILHLAETMIRLSGLEPDRDIAIQVVGARPGEKFHEDLFNPDERPQPTPAQKILLADREPLDPDWVERTFAEINLLVLEGDASALAKRVSTLSVARVRAADLDARIAT
jgi:FlaA1/EpsC-like NDP-sugar epimerase